jgi:sulfur carrier protein
VEVVFLQVVINNKKEDMPEGITVMDLITKKKLNPNTVIIELNGELAKQDTWPDLVLKENDRLEILRFVGGG